MLGIAMFIVGIWILRRVGRSTREYNPMPLRDQITLHEQARAHLKDEQLRELLARFELTNNVAISAVNRETKAKAALTSVLKAQGCTEEQIEQVIQVIDNE